MVWDEVAGIRLALESLPPADVLIASDSTAAVLAVVSAAAAGKARTGDLVRVVDLVGFRLEAGFSVRLVWGKAHVGVGGNEAADSFTKDGCVSDGAQQMTEGGVRAFWKALRARERAVPGFGGGRVTKWGRRAVSRYTQMRSGKGDVGEWRRRPGRGDGKCRLCGVGGKTGLHVVFKCHGCI